MFFHGRHGRAEIWFTDVHDGDMAQVGPRERLAGDLGLSRLSVMDQVHGCDVVIGGADGSVADAQLTDRPGQALLVKIADCVPVVLATDTQVAVVHVGRRGLVGGIVGAAIGQLNGPVSGWIGPRICGRCYELPADLADAVEAAVPGTRSTTGWGTPASDLAAGVRRQLEAAGAEVHDVGGCTLEDERFFSHRRTGQPARLGAIAVLR